MSKPVFWEGRVTIGGIELPARGTLKEAKGEPLKLAPFGARGSASFTFVLDLEAAPCSGCGATQGAGHWPACPIASAVVTFFEALFRLHERPTVAALLADAMPEARMLVKGAFLDQARTHAPEWAPLLEVDE